MVDPTSVTEIDEVEGYFLDQHYSGISDDDITDMFECYLNRISGKSMLKNKKLSDR